MRIGIEAQTVVPAARLHLRARPFIALDDITGKTPREVWQSFDNQVDRQIDSLVRFQSHGFRP